MKTMKMNLNACLLVVMSLLTTSCEREELSYSGGDFRIKIEAGDNWLHEYPLFLGLSKDNPPQFAVWLEDTNGNYLSTVFVTYKIASESWLSNKGNRRKEALPYWCHQRGIKASDGLYLPTKEEPLTDGITGATPKADKEIQLRINDFIAPIVIMAEFNHSIDFNDAFPKNAKEGDPDYSGGDGGSGQPAIVYSGIMVPGQDFVDLEMIGRSCADGSDGRLYTDLEKLTTAKSIVKKIRVQLVK